MGKDQGRLILMRHGRSEFNKLNLFTGWIDVPLSLEGIEEALEAGRRLAAFPLRQVFVSTLIRSQMTALLALARPDCQKVPRMIHSEGDPVFNWDKIYGEEALQRCIPVTAAWQLNERKYGILQGKNKKQMEEEYGAEQVHLWRRSFYATPPEGESLEMTAARVLPYFYQEIEPRVHNSNESVLVVAHGNSLRVIIQALEKISADQVETIEVETGKPLAYRFDNQRWRSEPLER